MEAVIWFGIAALIVIAAVIAAIGRPGDGPGRGGRNVASRGSRRRVGSYSGVAGYGAWSGDSGSSGCGDSSGGGSSGGDCGGGGF
ncbi:hypothetical protein [Pseudonocardia adelaidensis]|uniref:Loricrin n=1 Tax=Pseudonocardia adelaidensis TaxID=648754 RepID=A0ABP9N942_9PSEU